MALERVREGEAGLDVLAHGGDGLAQELVLDLLLEHVERAQERHAGRDHRRELAGEDRQLGRLDPLRPEPQLHLEPALALLERHDLQAALLELAGDGLLVGAGDLAGLRDPREVDRLEREGGHQAALASSDSGGISTSLMSSSGLEERDLATSIVILPLRTRPASEASIVCMPCDAPVWMSE